MQKLGIASIVVSLLSLICVQALPAQKTFASPDCSAGTSLNIVAHEDDDLIYVNPKIQQDINAGRCVETIFVTAGEGGHNPAQPYWESREAGMDEAYKFMIGSAAMNANQNITIASHTASLHTFTTTDKVSMVFLHLPDGGNTSSSPGNNGDSLRKLWQGDLSTVNTVISGQPSYTKQQLIDVLRARMNSVKPDIIRTLDFSQDFSSDDHNDHVAVALFTEAAAQDYNLPHQLLGYEGYEVWPLSANVTGQELTDKQNAFLAYDAELIAATNCPTGISSCDPNMLNNLERNYVGATSTKTARQFETLDGATADRGQTPATVQFGSDLWAFYYDATAGDLRYAKADSSTPTSWNTGTIDTTGNVGRTPAAVVHNNTLHVFYYDVTNTNLRHAWLPSGGSWQMNNHDGDPGSIAQRAGHVDTGLMPAVTVYGTSMQLFYFEPGSTNLRHSWSNSAGTSWSFETFDGDAGSILQNTADTGYDPTVTVYNNTLQLFYYDATNGNLRHVYENSGWHQETLDGHTSDTAGRRNTTLGLNPSVAVHGNTLQVVYYDQTNEDLRHAWLDSNGWHFENLDGDTGSIAKRSGAVGATPYITSDGTTLHVFAHDVTNSDLRHYWASSAQPWQTETLDGRGEDGTAGRINGNTGEEPVAIAFAGGWHVFYYGASGTNFRHAIL